MRARATAALFLAVLLLAAAPDENEEGEKKEGASAKDNRGENERVAWRDYETAVKNGRERGLPVVVVFWAENCRKCEVLEDKSFNRPDNACYVNEKFSAARVKDADRPDLKKKFRVPSCPVVWFLSPEGEEIDFFAGYVPPARLSVILHYVGEGEYKNKKFSEFEKEIKADK